MTRDMMLLLAGAGIGLVCSLLTTLVQHLLSLQADKVRRKRDRLTREKEELRSYLTQGIAKLELQSLREQLTGSDDSFRLHSPIDTTKFTAWQVALDKEFTEVEQLISKGDLQEAECRLTELEKQAERVRDQLEKD